MLVPWWVVSFTCISWACSMCLQYTYRFACTQSILIVSIWIVFGRCVNSRNSARIHRIHDSVDENELEGLGYKKAKNDTNNNKSHSLIPCKSHFLLLYSWLVGRGLFSYNELNRTPFYLSFFYGKIKFVHKGETQANIKRLAICVNLWILLIVSENMQTYNKFCSLCWISNIYLWHCKL